MATLRLPSTTSADDELALSFAAGKPGSLEAAYSRYAPFLRSVARSVLVQGDDADDCVHDVLLRVWNAPGTYRTERGSLRAFLIVCVRNEAIGRVRTAARRTHIEERAARETPVVHDPLALRDPVERSRLAAALRALSPEHRTVIELAYFGGCTQREIALQLDLPLGTVKSRSAHALRLLASALRPPNA